MLLHNIVKWGLVALFVLSAIARVDAIGEERQPVTKGQAIANIIIYAGLVSLIINYL